MHLPLCFSILVLEKLYLQQQYWCNTPVNVHPEFESLCWQLEIFQFSSLAPSCLPVQRGCYWSLCCPSRSLDAQFLIIRMLYKLNNYTQEITKFYYIYAFHIFQFIIRFIFWCHQMAMDKVMTVWRWLYISIQYIRILQIIWVHFIWLIPWAALVCIFAILYESQWKLMSGIYQTSVIGKPFSRDYVLYNFSFCPFSRIQPWSVGRSSSEWHIRDQRHVRDVKD